MDLWPQLLTLILTPAIIVGALTFLLKGVITRAFDRDLETFKGRLQAQLVEFQTRFSIIHQKRTEVIGELHSLLVDCTEAVSDLVSLIQFVDSVTTLPQKKSEAAKSLDNLRAYHRKHRIYVDAEICTRVDTLLDGAAESFRRLVLTQQGEMYTSDKSGQWLAAWKKMRDEIEPLMKNLEERFRKQLDANYSRESL